MMPKSNLLSVATNIQGSGGEDLFFHLIVGNGNLGKEQIPGSDLNVFQRYFTGMCVTVIVTYLMNTSTSSSATMGKP